MHEEQGGALSTLEVPSFESVYAQYFDFVWASARRLGVRPASMDDVVQEIFMVIHGKLHTLRQPESLRSWIYGIVRRTVSGHHRSQRTRDASDVALALHAKAHEETQLTPLELTEHNEEAKLLWQLLGEVEETKREVLVLVEMEGMTAPEISDALEIPLNTVYSRLRAARLAFEAALGRQAARTESRGRRE
ncbi:MAG TPA: RNA polymerase sigma factor [Polyangiaceae bacterium]|nr:RNA polymerase sigma factor [Polyangiaceae bacterium]